MRQYRHGLFQYNVESRDAIVQARQAVESSLKQVMVRTERLASTPDRGGMLVSHESRLSVELSDVEHYLAVQRTANAVAYGDTMEYLEIGALRLQLHGGLRPEGEVHQGARRAEDAGQRAGRAVHRGPSPLLSKARRRGV